MRSPVLRTVFMAAALQAIGFDTLHAQPGGIAGIVQGQTNRQVIGADSNEAAARLIKPDLQVRDQLSVTALASSDNGAYVAAAFRNGLVTVWSLDKGREVLRRQLPSGEIGAIAASSTGTFALLSDGRRVSNISADGSSDVAPGSGVTALAVDKSERRAALGYRNGAIEVWDLEAHRKVATLPGNQPLLAVGFDAAQPGSLIVLAGDGVVRESTIEGPARVIAKFPKSIRAGSVSPAARKVMAVSTAGTILSLNIATAAITEIRNIPAPPTTLAIPAQGATVLLGTRTGDLMLADGGSGERLARLATTNSGWAVIDFSGRFDGNSRGIDAVAWKSEAATVELTAFAKRYFEPGVLSTLTSGDRNALSAVPEPVSAGVSRPPDMSVTLPQGTAREAGKPYQLVVLAEDLGGGAEDVRLFHNGKLVDRGSLLQAQEVTKGARKIRALAFSVLPTPGLNTFRASATNRSGVEGVSTRVSAEFSGAPVAQKLHVLSIGINQYSGRIPSLALATADATAVSAALSAKTGSYTSVENTLLTDANATRAGILAALRKVGESSAPVDTLVVFFAGHGAALGRDQWVFLANDSDARSEDALRRTSITVEDLQAALLQAKAHRIILAIDSCQSGTVSGTFANERSVYLRLMNDFNRSNGFIIYAATQEANEALEIDKLGHGVFTYAFLKGLEGAGVQRSSVTAFALADYLESNVPTLAQLYKQREQDTAIFRLGVDFPVR